MSIPPMGPRDDTLGQDVPVTVSDDPLFVPYQVGAVRLRNRVVVAPMGSGRNIISDAGLDWYGKLAAGQPGLLMVQASNVEWLTDPSVAVADLARLANEIHRQGVVALVQLVRQDFPWRSATDLPPAEIKGCRMQFAAAARRCQEAGFDGVEIHGAHGYLLNQFFSRYKNRREDAYGGSLENRMRLAVTLINAVREAVRSDFLVAYRHTPRSRFARYVGRDILVEVDYDIPDSLVLIATLRDTGLDIADISPGRGQEAGDLSGHFVGHGLPVISVGGFDVPAQARYALSHGRCDLVAVGRGFVADRRWLQKVRAGSEDKILRCLRCNECFNAIQRGEQLRCFRVETLDALRRSALEPMADDDEDGSNPVRD